MEQEGSIFPGVDPDRANVARVYDYLLGGTHNFDTDQDVARAMTALVPAARDVAKASRAFLGRAVRFLAESGIRQFLDIGSGVPTDGNVHDVARAVAPESRVVYVEIDPVAIAHSKSILAEDDNAAIVDADLREPEVILGHPDVTRLIDFDQPVGLLLVAVLPFISDEEQPADLVRRLTRPLVPGSYLTVSHPTFDGRSASVAQAVQKVYSRTTVPVKLRGQAEIRGFFDGFELVEPGLVFLPRWRPDRPAPFCDEPELSWNYAGVGRKP